MPITIARKYKTKDIEMLTATATIIENAIANKAFYNLNEQLGLTHFLKI